MVSGMGRVGMPDFVELKSPDSGWPKCYYIPDQFCGDKAFCHCPSCPVKVAITTHIFKEKQEPPKGLYRFVV